MILLKIALLAGTCLTSSTAPDVVVDTGPWHPRRRCLLRTATSHDMVDLMLQVDVGVTYQFSLHVGLARCGKSIQNFDGMTNLHDRLETPTWPLRNNFILWCGCRFTCSQQNDSLFTCQQRMNSPAANRSSIANASPLFNHRLGGCRAQPYGVHADQRVRWVHDQHRRTTGNGRR